MTRILENQNESSSGLLIHLPTLTLLFRQQLLLDLTASEKRLIQVIQLMKTFPRALQDSIDALKNDKGFLKPYFSNELIDTYVELKSEGITFATGSKERQFMLYCDI